jgi:hypothetical protein
MAVFGLISMSLSAHWRELRSVYVLQVLRLQLVLEADYRVQQAHVRVVSRAQVLHVDRVGLGRRQLAADCVPVRPHACRHHLAHRQVTHLSRCEHLALVLALLG